MNNNITENIKRIIQNKCTIEYSEHFESDLTSYCDIQIFFIRLTFPKNEIVDENDIRLYTQTEQEWKYLSGIVYFNSSVYGISIDKNSMKIDRDQDGRLYIEIAYYLDNDVDIDDHELLYNK